MKPIVGYVGCGSQSIEFVFVGITLKHGYFKVFTNRTEAEKIYNKVQQVEVRFVEKEKQK